MPCPVRPLMLATSNPIKVAVITRILRPHKLFPFDVQMMPRAGSEIEIQGRASDITRTKMAIARAALTDSQQAARALILLDDTSMDIPALGGMPGPYLKQFGANIGSLPRRLSEVSGDAKFSLSAILHSHLTLARGKSELSETFTGRVTGELVCPAPGGSESFGSCFRAGLGWPPDVDYDDIENRLRYGCHYARSVRKMYLLLTLRNAAELEIMKRQTNFSEEDFRDFIIDHVKSVLPGVRIASSTDDERTSIFSEIVTTQTTEWLFRNLLQYGIRIAQLRRVKTSVLTKEALLRCSLLQDRESGQTLELGEAEA
eukprot:TRINITY_DN68275_c0_g1_i1.p1 TRINITY_DN68275_c0_g1~~TRINITY_DN68275_c0_g1_i1.p1  ORF type:complete len:315 (+),score=30.19 TRINITY_DN68275_c0_g1_i1:102-1046(+)